MSVRPHTHTGYREGGVLQSEAVKGLAERLEALELAASRAVPPGTVLAFAGGTPPDGFLLCDGTSYATASYGALFAALGYAWGGSGANFNVPDLRDKAITGVGTRVLAASNGSTTLAHSATSIPDHAAHTHQVTAAGTNSGGSVSAHSTPTVPAHTAHATATVDNNLDGSIVSVTSGTTHSAHTVTGPTSHTFTQPTFAGSAVASGDPSATLSHAVTGPSDHTGVEMPNRAMHYVVKT